MHPSNSLREMLSIGLVRCAFLALAAFGLLFSAANANAACGDPRGLKQGVAHKMPFLGHPDDQGGQNPGNHSIVGLWHVTYTSGGELFYEAFDEWHSDGTEIESANASPIEGNVCMGAWRQADGGTVHLNHVGWTFDQFGDSTGTFTLTETNKVGLNGNTYTGGFDYKAYDADGNLVFELTGKLTATRIAAD